MSINSFPTPPAVYYNQYTDENISRGAVPGPPPLPPRGEVFHAFGSPQWNDDHIVRPLETLGIKRLYPQHFDRKKELKKVLHSALAMFLDLIDTVVKCPRSTKRNEKLEDLTLLFIHMQHLLNEYRVHQAREIGRTMMEVQRRHTNEVTDRLGKHVEMIAEKVAGFSGTSTTDQAQKLLAANLKWEIASQQARLAELKNDHENSEEMQECVTESDEALFDFVWKNQ
ncbi:mediator of RNA polymerase II transcription subunit 7-like [Paramacrobiotus metropolitanus]|uniref:mediator of RNA polymerase II transcription subunit 7-like n=1 Tax=Paramacrobiotus metropolitanus TaxID=2943436 RepID=UPI0024457CEA|nr:mediator of RNA polymerase II transcription subunit 7-like [Paramacrobiotus metropolitanus]XP_055333619.1 mediator of RNA polymerase II transcription subunit 7-like [Paramacrobiotus metropolitanus]